MAIKIFILLALLGLSLAENRTTKLKSNKADVNIKYFYGVNNDNDGDFIISQLIPAFQSSSSSFFPSLELTFPIGGIQIIRDDVFDKYHCTAKDSICETSLIHHCIELIDGVLVNFLKCYFQSELYFVDLVGASKECFFQYDTQADWDAVIACSKDEQSMIDFARIVLDTQDNSRPTFEQTPHIFLSDVYSDLAAIDLKKALCRATATDIWQCESVDRYKEPKAEIYYTVYDQVASDFFLNQFTNTIVQSVMDTTVELDIIPNPNKIIGCDQNDDSCWSHKAHWCIYLNQAGTTQVETIKCTFGKSSSISAQDKVQQCAPNIFTEIQNCVNTLGQSNSAVKNIQTRLNLLVGQSQQEAIEVIIKDQSSVKAKNGILQELCYNYFEIDNETLGCKVTLPKVQIFYESQNAEVVRAFNQLKYQAQYAPFETVAQWEFIPYGQTTYQNGNYACAQEHQCEANWLHACLFAKRFSTVDEQYLFIKFFSCAISYNANKNPLDLAEECINKVYDDGPDLYPELLFCAHSDDALKESLRIKTEAISLTQAPEIVIDGVKRTSDVGLDTVGYVCGNSFNPIKPRVCFDIEKNMNQTLQLSVFLTADQNTQSFVQSQIKPLLSDKPRDADLLLRDVIEWNFVPWGPTVYNSASGVVDCANGVEECLANRILTCATRIRSNGKLGIREDKLRVASFVVCFFDSVNWKTNPLEAANLCSPKLSQLDNYGQLLQCAVQDRKLKLLLDMKTLTENNYPKITNFPAVSIDQQRLEDISDLAKGLCSYYKASSLPAECETYPTTTPTSTIPDSTTPEITTPEITTPEITTPEITTPEITTPEITTPEITTLDPGSGTTSNQLSRIVMSIFSIWIIIIIS